MTLALLQECCESLKQKFSAPGQPSSPEDQLKTPISTFLEGVGAAQGLEIVTNTESHINKLKVRPDIAVREQGLICGYVELKAPGKGADAPKLKSDHDIFSIFVIFRSYIM